MIPNLYYSSEATDLIRDAVGRYIYKETGLTLRNLYSLSDHMIYREVREEAIPEELWSFITIIEAMLQPIEEEYR